MDPTPSDVRQCPKCQQAAVTVVAGLGGFFMAWQLFDRTLAALKHAPVVENVI